MNTAASILSLGGLGGILRTRAVVDPAETRRGEIPLVDPVLLVSPSLLELLLVLLLEALLTALLVLLM